VSDAPAALKLLVDEDRSGRVPDGYALWPKNAKYFFDYVDRSYSGTGKDAYAYCTANSSALTMFSASFLVPGATAAWNANYNLACRKTNTCP
jgi:hypothetical protein